MCFKDWDSTTSHFCIVLFKLWQWNLYFVHEYYLWLTIRFVYWACRTLSWWIASNFLKLLQVIKWWVRKCCSEAPSLVAVKSYAAKSYVQRIWPFSDMSRIVNNFRNIMKCSNNKASMNLWNKKIYDWLNIVTGQLFS